jgi:ATP-binding cassette subfamily F protein 3
MAVASGTNLSKYYGAEHIFSGVNFMINRGDKIALVGINGAGKTTLLKLIAGLEEATTGTINFARGTRGSYLAQEAQFAGERTLIEEAHQALAHLYVMEQELRELEALIADTDHLGWEAHMERYGNLLARFEHAGGYDTGWTIRRMLEGLGFTSAQFEQSVREFSGGQKTRAALAITLLQDPDLLLLDEPTNHLDLPTLQWLEEFLRTWPGTLVVISHDRYFLDKVATRTFELAWGKLTDWPGNYSKYLRLKAERDERLQKEYTAQQGFIAKEEEFIRRHMAGQRTKEAQGRLKRLNRFKYGWDSMHGFVKESLDAPRTQQRLKLDLAAQHRSGYMILSFSDSLTVGYRTPEGEKVVVRTPALELHRQERVAMLGGNGTGKTTLLRTIVGELPPLAGRITRGVGGSVGYYAQVHDELNLENTVLEEVHRVKPLETIERIRNLLARFLFTGDDVFKRVGDLSGGERSRVALAQLTLKAPNLLILDEPTNHLDIAAREALESVLQEFDGTILFVSHDRYFIDALADKIWLMEAGTVSEFEGTYTEYAAYLMQQTAQPARQKSQSQHSSVDQVTSNSDREPRTTGLSAREHRERDRQQRERQKRVNALERHIGDLERQLHVVQTAIETATTQGHLDDIARLGEDYVVLEQRLQEQYERWAELAEGM